MTRAQRIKFRKLIYAFATLAVGSLRPRSFIISLAVTFHCAHRLASRVNHSVMFRDACGRKSTHTIWVRPLVAGANAMLEYR